MGWKSGSLTGTELSPDAVQTSWKSQLEIWMNCMGQLQTVKLLGGYSCEEWEGVPTFLLTFSLRILPGSCKVGG